MRPTCLATRACEHQALLAYLLHLPQLGSGPAGEPPYTHCLAIVNSGAPLPAKKCILFAVDILRSLKLQFESIPVALMQEFKAQEAGTGFPASPDCNMFWYIEL